MFFVKFRAENVKAQLVTHDVLLLGTGMMCNLLFSFHLMCPPAPSLQGWEFAHWFFKQIARFL